MWRLVDRYREIDRTTDGISQRVRRITGPDKQREAISQQIHHHRANSRKSSSINIKRVETLAMACQRLASISYSRIIRQPCEMKLNRERATSESYDASKTWLYNISNQSPIRVGQRFKKMAIEVEVRVTIEFRYFHFVTLMKYHGEQLRANSSNGKSLM